MAEEPLRRRTRDRRQPPPLFHALCVATVFEGEEHLKWPVSQCRPWRMNLLASSQDDPSVFYMAVNDELQCYRCRHPKDPKPLLFRTLSAREATGITINAVAVGRLGGAEVVVTVNDEGLVQCWFTASLDRHPLLFHNASSTWGISTHDATRLLGVSANSHRITVFNLQFSQHASGDDPFCSSPNAKSPLNAKKRVLFGHDHNIPDIDFSPCGWYLASCSIDGTCRIWKLDTGQVVWKDTFNAGGWSVHFVSPSAFKHLPFLDVSRIPLRKGYPAFQTRPKKLRNRLYRVGSFLQLFHPSTAVDVSEEATETDTETESAAEDNGDDSNNDISLNEFTPPASDVSSQHGDGGQVSVTVAINNANNLEQAGQADVEMTNEQQSSSQWVLPEPTLLANNAVIPSLGHGTDLQATENLSVVVLAEPASVAEHDPESPPVVYGGPGGQGEEAEAFNQLDSASTGERVDTPPRPVQVFSVEDSPLLPFGIGFSGGEEGYDSDAGGPEDDPDHFSSDESSDSPVPVAPEPSDPLSATSAGPSVASASAEVQGGTAADEVAGNDGRERGNDDPAEENDSPAGGEDGAAFGSSGVDAGCEGSATDGDQGHPPVSEAGQGWETQGPAQTFTFEELPLPVGPIFGFDNVDEDDCSDDSDLQQDVDDVFSECSDDSTGPVVPDPSESPVSRGNCPPMTDGGDPANGRTGLGDPLLGVDLGTPPAALVQGGVTPMEATGGVSADETSSPDGAQENPRVSEARQGWEMQGPVRTFPFGELPLPPGTGFSFDNVDEGSMYSEESELEEDVDYTLSEYSDDSTGPVVPDPPESPTSHDGDRPPTIGGGDLANSGTGTGDPLSGNNLGTPPATLEQGSITLTEAAGGGSADEDGSSVPTSHDSQGTATASEGWGLPQGLTFSFDDFPFGMNWAFDEGEGAADQSGLTDLEFGGDVYEENSDDSDVFPHFDAEPSTGPSEADEEYASAQEDQEDRPCPPRNFDQRRSRNSVGVSWNLEDRGSSPGSEEREGKSVPRGSEEPSRRVSPASEVTLAGEAADPRHLQDKFGDGVPRRHALDFCAKALLPEESVEIDDGEDTADAKAPPVSRRSTLPLVLLTTMRDLYLLRPATSPAEATAHAESRKRPRPDDGAETGEAAGQGSAGEDGEAAPPAKFERLVEITDVVARQDTRQRRRIVDFDRLNMVHWIPELSLALVGSQKGYIALVRMIRVYDDGNGQCDKSGHMRPSPSGDGKEGFILHIEGYLPLCDPPPLPLLGWFVTSHHPPASAGRYGRENSSTLSYHVVRMVYYNGVTMAYEIRSGQLANPASLALAIV